jgi:predicted metal-binding protein
MARIGILTCSNCTQETNCASVVCLGDMRKRRGFFESYPKDEPLALIGIINCAGCPTLAAPEKILKRVRALTEFHIDALHLSFCMVALCPFIKPYMTLIKREFSDINIVLGTHRPADRDHFVQGVKELLCQTQVAPQTMNDLMRGTLKIPVLI